MQKRGRAGKSIKSILTKCILCVLLLIKYTIYSMYQWTVCLENSLMDRVTAQAGAGAGEDKSNLR